MKMTMNVAATVGTSVTPAAAVGKGSDKSGSVEFLATMNQAMSKDTATGETLWATIGLPSANGQGLAAEAGSDELMQMIDSLLQNVEQSEQLLNDHPELLAMLQQWLQQAQVVTGGAQHLAEVQPELLSELQQLTANPETLVILVRDQLEQMRETIQATTQQAPSDSLVQGDEVKLLESLQSMLTRFKQADVATNEERATAQQQSALLLGGSSDGKLAVQATAVPTANTAPVNEKVPFENLSKQVKPVDSQITGVITSQSASTASVNENVSFENLLKQVKSADAQTTGVNASQTADSESSITSTLEDGSSEVITAGQLAIRAEGLKSAKPTPIMRAQHFAQDMGIYMKQMFISSRNGISEAKITLYPENLGQVDVRLTMQNGQLVASFVTEHAMAKDLLDQQMSLLRGALQSQGIQVEKLSVTQHTVVTTPDSLNASMYQGDQRPSDGNGKNAFSQRSNGNGSNEAELETIEDIRAELLRERMTGSSFQASV